MAKNLVIVESPGKIKTISGFLGKDYRVIASFGHIRELAKEGKYNLGIDLDNNFDAKYKNSPDKKDVIKNIKDEAKNAEIIYLASDLDLEGEAISWHIYDILNKAEKAKVRRITFNEITKKAVEDAIKNYREIDMDKVHAQETRRLLDRIVGFRLSHLVIAKTGSKSAGRVQSAALKILVEKEKEIQAFVPEEYFEVYLPFLKDNGNYEAKFNGTKKRKFDRLDTRVDADQIVKDCSTGKFIVDEINEKERKVNPKMPFTTSTFQQAASSSLGYAPKKSMMIAQKLYEGMTVQGEHRGLITYMRTDSTKLSDDFTKVALNHIKINYGKDYLGTVRVGKKVEGAQEAHEAIRPAYLELTPTIVKPFLNIEEFKVYELIYNRTLASLMAPAVVNHTTIDILNGKHLFNIRGKVILFDGFMKVYLDDSDENEGGVLPVFTKGEMINNQPLRVEQKWTQPPRRYSEAGLIKVLEELGIGRPSTYATIMDTLKARDYMEVQNKALVATLHGIQVIDMLLEHFGYIIDSDYTSNLEKRLDDIAEGQINHIDELTEFYNKFDTTLKIAQKETESIRPKAIETDKKCPKCGKDLVIRTSRKGDQFYACSGFPRCKFTASVSADGDMEVQDTNNLQTCNKCGKGHMIKRTASKGPSKGSIFYGCSDFPKCKNTMSEEVYQNTYFPKQHFSDLSTDKDI